MQLPSSSTLKTQPQHRRPPSCGGEGEEGGLQAGTSLVRIWIWRPVPLSPPPDCSRHDNRASNPVFLGNLHFNGDVIRIKKLRLEGTEPSPFPWEPETNPQALPRC